MELQQAFRRQWRALILVPGLTAMIAGVLFLTSTEPTYSARATVRVNEFIDADTTPEVRQVIDDLDAALDSRRVSEVVEAAAPGADLPDIQSTAIGDSGEVRVTLVGDDPQEVEAALEAGVREALTTVSEVRVRQVGRQLVAADGVARDAVQDLQEIENDVGAPDLQAELERRSGDILALRNQIAAAAENGTVRRALEETLEIKQAEFDAISQELLGWTNSRERFNLSITASAEAALQLRNLEVSEADLQTTEILQSLTIAEQSVLTDLVRVVVAAALVTGAAVVLLTLAAGSRRGGPVSGRRAPARSWRDDDLADDRWDDDEWDDDVDDDERWSDRDDDERWRDRDEAAARRSFYDVEDEPLDHDGLDDTDEPDGVMEDVDDEVDDEYDEYDDESDVDEMNGGRRATRESSSRRR
ncbi:MAG: hypothetical protein AAF945_07520 [Actinomycetota bacterium]